MLLAVGLRTESKDHHHQLYAAAVHGALVLHRIPPHGSNVTKSHLSNFFSVLSLQSAEKAEIREQTAAITPA